MKTILVRVGAFVVLLGVGTSLGCGRSGDPAAGLAEARLEVTASGTVSARPVDLDRDGDIDVEDLQRLLARRGTSCTATE